MPARAEPPARCDLAIVGGGILGLAVARELSHRHGRLSVCVLEREAQLAVHQSGHNSGVIHAGLYYAPGSLKARLCVQGASELYEYCAAHEIPHRACGKLVVATRETEVPRLRELFRRGTANGVPELRWLDRDQIEAVEPHARGLAGLHSPRTGVVDFGAVARSYAGDALGAGARIVTSCAVHSAVSRERGLRLNHEHGTTQARHAIFCAGAWSDRLAVACGAGADPRIVPFRGAYMRLRARRRELVRALIYPVPDPALPFLGVHFTRRIDGEVLIGPTALIVAGRGAYAGSRATAHDAYPQSRARAHNAHAGSRARAHEAYAQSRARAQDALDTVGWPGTWRLLARHWRAGAAELHAALRPRTLVSAAARYVPELDDADVEPAFAGIRAQALARDGTLLDDFVFSRTGRALHVRNAPSPGATSSLAIARHVADEAGRAFDLEP